MTPPALVSDAERALLPETRIEKKIMRVKEELRPERVDSIVRVVPRSPHYITLKINIAGLLYLFQRLKSGSTISKTLFVPQQS